MATETSAEDKPLDGTTNDHTYQPNNNNDNDNHPSPPPQHCCGRPVGRGGGGGGGSVAGCRCPSAAAAATAPPSAPASISSHLHQPLQPPPTTHHHQQQQLAVACCSAQDDFLSRRQSQFWRTNGFQRPLHAFQIASWFLFAADILIFYLVLIPAVDMVMKIVFGVVFLLLAVGVFVSAWQTTVVDPADPRAYCCETGTASQLFDVESSAYCDLCGTIDLRSKHCRACNKCVAVFDHHCKWLNNCVGKNNYRWFLVLVVLVGLMTLVILGLSIWVIVKESVYENAQVNWIDAYGYSSNVVVYFFSSLLILVNLPLFALDLQLLSLHLYLVQQRITTYEYITRRVHQDEVAGSTYIAPTDGNMTTEKRNVRLAICRGEKCWAEWIVLDRRKMKKARAKMKLGPASAPASEGEVAAAVTPAEHEWDIQEIRDATLVQPAAVQQRSAPCSSAGSFRPCERSSEGDDGRRRRREEGRLFGDLIGGGGGCWVAVCADTDNCDMLDSRDHSAEGRVADRSFVSSSSPSSYALDDVR
eukprot:GHVS01079885.1.p1 GENE.GHVS01079885.1~~GHVS01079885.1.p1  ORF type:complete len:530 (-),score=132.57 GHVS01079885.1:258-1847(-)